MSTFGLRAGSRPRLLTDIRHTRLQRGMRIDVNSNGTCATGHLGGVYEGINGSRVTWAVSHLTDLSDIMSINATSSKRDTTIAVVGGGIGGILTAIGLGKHGYDVHLFEQAPKFSEIGAGIAM
jgi:hypothetical protein